MHFDPVDGEVDERTRRGGAAQAEPAAGGRWNWT